MVESEEEKLMYNRSEFEDMGGSVLDEIFAVEGRKRKTSDVPQEPPLQPTPKKKKLPPKLPTNDSIKRDLSPPSATPSDAEETSPPLRRQQSEAAHPSTSREGLKELVRSIVRSELQMELNNIKETQLPLVNQIGLLLKRTGEEKKEEEDEDEAEDDKEEEEVEEEEKEEEEEEKEEEEETEDKEEEKREERKLEIFERRSKQRNDDVAIRKEEKERKEKARLEKERKDKEKERKDKEKERKEKERKDKEMKEERLEKIRKEKERKKERLEKERKEREESKEIERLEKERKEKKKEKQKEKVMEEEGVEFVTPTRFQGQHFLRRRTNKPKEDQFTNPSGKEMKVNDPVKVNPLLKFDQEHLLALKDWVRNWNDLPKEKHLVDLETSTTDIKLFLRLLKRKE